MQIEKSETAGGFDIQAPLKKILGLGEIVERRRLEGFKVIPCRENLEIRFPLDYPSGARSDVRIAAYSEMAKIFSSPSWLFPEETVRIIMQDIEFLGESADRTPRDRLALLEQQDIARAVLIRMQERSLESYIGEDGMDLAQKTEAELGSLKEAGVFFGNTPDPLVRAVARVYSLAFAYSNLFGKACIVTPRSHFGRVLMFHRDLTQWQKFYPHIEIYGSQKVDV